MYEVHQFQTCFPCVSFTGSSLAGILSDVSSSKNYKDETIYEDTFLISFNVHDDQIIRKKHDKNVISYHNF